MFLNGDSREPEIAGVLGAVIGSLYTILITLLISFPIGVFTAIYLENFAVKNRITDFIEVNINNLAAVPSIIFGLLGLALFINFFGMVWYKFFIFFFFLFNLIYFIFNHFIS